MQHLKIKNLDISKSIFHTEEEILKTYPSAVATTLIKCIFCNIHRRCWLWLFLDWNSVTVAQMCCSCTPHFLNLSARGGPSICSKVQPLMASKSIIVCVLWRWSFWIYRFCQYPYWDISYQHFRWTFLSL